MIHSYFQSVSNEGLPWLQFDNLVKPAKITYMGESEIIVFYNQLYNIANAYGVFLRQLQELKLNMSVFPDAYNGITISAAPKAQMANCLYLILQSPDTIPLEYTWAHNIISRGATANNGYKVLYCMVEPILNKDTVLEQPNSTECADVHEYARKFESYIQV